MDSKSIKKEDLFNVIKHGHAWYAQKIKEELDKLLIMNSNRFNHDFSYDSQDKYHFIYDNECYLFVFDGRIELRSDRDNVFSTDKTFEYKIKDSNDILKAYEHFNSLTMEDEED